MNHAVYFIKPCRKSYFLFRRSFGIWLAYDARGNVKGENDYQTVKPNIFTAGDVRRGQSLIVWAISEGREAAHQIDKHLMGHSTLPQKNTTGDLVAV